MPTSYYLGPRQPRFTPSSWADIEMASDSGLFDETQWVERKKDIPPKSGPANLELARDLASLSVDGGVLIVGITDSQKGIPGTVTGTVDAGLADRIAQVAQGRVSPPLNVMVDRFLNPADRTHAVLVVTVPASAGAPHMVDGSYWGRSENGKCKLSDGDVRRLIGDRQARAAGFKERLAAVQDDLNIQSGLLNVRWMYLLLEPTAQPQSSISGTLDRVGLVQFLQKAAPQGLQDQYGLRSLLHSVPHPEGHLARTWHESDTDSWRDERSTVVLIDDSGVWKFGTGNTISPVGSADDRNSGATVLRAASMLKKIHSVFTAAAYLSTELCPINSDWMIGLKVGPLLGIEPVENHSSLFEGGRPYPKDDYVGVISSTTQELATQPAVVVERLTGNLLRGFGIKDRYLPYEDPSDLGRR
ncbi:helix-turn-helix domain-containing protein [Nocardia salmonicida]|uniref:helix-turn-helix domain-containing protein n=1 Tax=Nocardia salmonicida TaxID=53431 RepID=UPI00379B19C8